MGLLLAAFTLEAFINFTNITISLLHKLNKYTKCEKIVPREPSDLVNVDLEYSVQGTSPCGPRSPSESTCPGGRRLMLPVLESERLAIFRVRVL